MKIESYLPIFPGFYNTIFEANDEDSIIEAPHSYEDYEFNYEKYRQDVAKECVDNIERELSKIGFPIKVKYEKIYSPPFYNYSNDSIYVSYTLSKKIVKEIYGFLQEHKDSLEKYIKDRFTCYSGFTSYYSNDVNDWLNPKIININASTVLGSILEFILLECDYDQESLYYDMEDVCLEGELRN